MTSRKYKCDIMALLSYMNNGAKKHKQPKLPNTKKLYDEINAMQIKGFSSATRSATVTATEIASHTSTATATGSETAMASGTGTFVARHAPATDSSTTSETRTATATASVPDHSGFCCAVSRGSPTAL